MFVVAQLNKRNLECISDLLRLKNIGEHKFGYLGNMGRRGRLKKGGP